MQQSPKTHRLIQKIMHGRQPSYVTQSLIVMNLVWFLYMTVAGVSLTRPDPVLLVRFGALFGPMVYQGELWRLLSCQFVHIGFMHIGFNMYVLFAIGRDLEIIYGRIPFLILYFFSGFCGALASLWAHPMSLSAGASGAIFGLAGGTLSFYLRLHEPLLKNLFQRWRNSLLLFVIYNGIFGLIIPGIDNFAHFGGLAGGFAMGYVISSPEGSETEHHTRTILGIILGCGFLYMMVKFLGLPL